MKKTLLLLFLLITQWQTFAQLKISTTAPKLCAGEDVLFQITNLPNNANLQLQRNEVDFLALNNASFILKNCPPGNYSAKALGKDLKWNRKSPDVDYGYLNDAFFVNTQIGYAVGEAGLVIKTTDGGSTWQEQKPVTGNPLNSVYFINELIGFAAGGYSTIIKTDDGGKTWNTVPAIRNVDPYDAYFSIKFLDSKIGTITNINGQTIRTLDGGNSWTATPINYDNYSPFFKSFFIDKNIGYVCDFWGNIKKTTDAGLNWTKVYDINLSDPLPNYSQRYFTSIYFFDSNNGWAVGIEGIFITTSDGGKTWTKKNIDKSLNFNNIIFTDKNNGIATTYGKEYLQTTDGGKTWIAKSVSINMQPLSSSFIDSKTGWMIGYGGLVLKTTDGANTWQKMRGNTDNYRDVNFINPQIGFRVGGYGLIEKTTDGGSTWKAQNSTVTDYLKQVQFIDANNGWVLPYSDQYILITTDGGSTWKKQNARVNDWVIKAFKFVDTKNGLFAGYQGTIGKTTDGGLTWTQIKNTIDTNSNPNDIFFYDAKNVWIAGERGTIAKSLDGGNTWTQLKLGLKYNNDSFLSIFFIDTKVGWALSNQSRILKTTDGGNTWTEINFSGSNSQSIIFFDSKNGVIVTAESVYKTIDGGMNWTAEEAPKAKSINRAIFLNSQLGWAVGEGNTYFKYETPLLATSNIITINPKPAVPTLAWSNSDGKLTATTTTTSPLLTWLKGVDELKNITTTTYQPTSSGTYSVRVTDANGCSEVSKTVEVTILSNDDPLNSSGINVYPNPSHNGSFKVSYTRFSNETDANLQIIGLDGLPIHSQKMERQNNTFESDVNVNQLPTGIYFLQIISGEQKNVIKISIAK